MGLVRLARARDGLTGGAGPASGVQAVDDERGGNMMDLEGFRRSPAERVVQVGHGQAAYWAFIPNPLAPDDAYPCLSRPASRRG